MIDNKTIGESTYESRTNSHWFEAWFAYYLCPKLPENCVVIMDNARFHRKKQLRDIAEVFGFRIIFLPPYSPDKNPIEKLWANMKRWLKKWAHLYKSIQDAIMEFFRQKTKHQHDCQ